MHGTVRTILAVRIRNQDSDRRAVRTCRESFLLLFISKIENSVFGNTKHQTQIIVLILFIFYFYQYQQNNIESLQGLCLNEIATTQQDKLSPLYNNGLCFDKYVLDFAFILGRIFLLDDKVTKVFLQNWFYITLRTAKFGRTLISAAPLRRILKVVETEHFKFRQ